jgi:zinc/manganese transport system ATP-binding protein
LLNYHVTSALFPNKEKRASLHPENNLFIALCPCAAHFCCLAAGAGLAGHSWGTGMSIVLHNLTAGYDRHPAVHHLCGTLQDNSLTAIIGPNGGGKSTLVKVMAGLLKPLSGTILRSEKSRIGYLPQVANIDRSFPMSVFDTVCLGFWPENGIFGGINKHQRHKAMHVLEKVGMDSFAGRPVAALSSGQFQRVLFARLMLQNADIVLLDEPFAAIDSRTTEVLLHLLLEWHNGGKTVVAVLHDLPQVRTHFPQALLLARECMGWGDTASVMTEENFDRANALARQWHDHGEVCAA